MDYSKSQKKYPLFPEAETIDPWRKDERERQCKVEAGKAVIANCKRDVTLIAWAKSKGLAAWIDRRTIYGNPFHIGTDGDRDEVCDKYAAYLLENQSILNTLHELQGKVLVCHCFPLRCHGDELLKRITAEVTA